MGLRGHSYKQDISLDIRQINVTVCADPRT